MVWYAFTFREGSAMYQYHQLLNHVKVFGAQKGDRTGTGTTSIFGYQMRFDLSEGFPLMTTKKLHIPSIVHELLWFLKGDTNVKYLQENGVRIWNEWADKDGNLGPVYGAQWRSWGTSRYKYHGDDEFPSRETIDQISNVIREIKTNPDSRRLIVNAWNVGELDKMALPPCHLMFQFYVANGKLSCQLYQRSADIFLGVPFNIASYSLLVHMVAHVTGLEVGEFIHTLGDAHIYDNHREQVELQLSREMRKLPALEIKREVKDIFDFKAEDFAFVGYDPHPGIKGVVAV